jgi:lysozyme
MILFPVAVAFVLAKPVIMRAEGFCATPYMCPAGKPSIGYGSTYYEDGSPVKIGDFSISQSRGGLILTHAMMRVEGQMRPLLTRKPTSHQYAAMLDLTYNIGVGCHDGVKGDFADSTLLAKFNKGDIEGAAEEFLRWNKAHVKGVLTTLPGLVTRRHTDRALFLTPDK